MAQQELVIKVAGGQWYATQGDKHLTAAQTAKLIAGGVPYRFEN